MVKSSRRLRVPGRHFVVLDSETNGIYGDVRILSLAMVELHNGIVSNSKLWLVNPGNVLFDPGAIAVNGLTPDLLEDAPSFAEVIDEVADWLSAPDGKVLTLIGHKVSFDVRHLTSEFRRLGRTLPPTDVLDTTNLADAANVIPERRSLEALLRALGLSNSAPHTALGDTLATASAAIELMNRIATQRGADQLSAVIGELAGPYIVDAQRPGPASAPEIELTDQHLKAHLADLSDGRRRSRVLDVCFAEDCDIVATRMEDGIIRPEHARQVATWAFDHLFGDEQLSRVTAGRLLRGIGQALRRAESPAYAAEVYRDWLVPYLTSASECEEGNSCERCADKSGTCDFVGVVRRCVDAYIHDGFSPFTKPTRKRATEFLPGYNPDVRRSRGRPREGFYGELRRNGHLDAAGYGVARVADVRRAEGGRQWAYALLRKAWDDRCRTPRLAEMLASMTVVDAIGAYDTNAGRPDPKAPYVAAIAVIDECLAAYLNQSGRIFERLNQRRTRLARMRDTPPRPSRDPSKAINRRPPHATALGRPSSPPRGYWSAPSKVVLRLAAPTTVRRPAK